MMKKYAIELIGSFFFTFALWMTVPTSMVTGAGMMTRLSIGLTMTILVYAGAKISGGHYNPAISLAAFIQRRIGLSDTLKYMLVQVIGCVLAIFVVMYLLEPTQIRTEAAYIKNPIKALIAEFLATFLLAFVYLNVFNKDNQNSYYGIAIGLTITVMAYSVGTISGGVFNPIVFVSSTFINWGAWSDGWIYFVGCFGGAAVAAMLYNFFKNS